MLETQVLVGINCGSGQRPFTSTPEVRWINVDSQEKWSPDIVCDALTIPLSDESADYFVLHHVLEHFGCDGGDGIIKEAHRLLKPKGSLLVSVPDIRALAQKYVLGDIDEFIFKVNLYGAYMGDEADRHKWGYTGESLQTTLLNAAKWYNVRRFNNRRIPGMDFAADWWILAMEGVK